MGFLALFTLPVVVPWSHAEPAAIHGGFRVPPPTELVIDNLDANTQKTGSWLVSTGPNPWDGESRHNNHVIRYFIPGSMGDGIRDELSQLLNPYQVFHYSDSTLGRHYGFLVVDISPHPDDPNTWKATFRQARLDPAWAEDRSPDPLGGYYHDTDPAAYPGRDSKPNERVASGDFKSRAGSVAQLSFAQSIEK
ncbi:MAG TPA: hypothetical protein VGC53_07595 [Vicinamibacteria bacterium]